MNLLNTVGSINYQFGISNGIIFSVDGMEMCNLVVWCFYCSWVDYSIYFLYFSDFFVRLFNFDSW